jgi:hypothetical protein
VSSDHHPLLVDFQEEKDVCRSYRRGFKFEEGWKNDAAFLDVVRSAWEGEEDRGMPKLTVLEKLSSCQRSLSRWSKLKFGNVDEELKTMTRQLLELQHHNNPALTDSIRQLKGKIEALLEREDVKWKQRAKRSWYRQGDRNTRYFHSWANQLRKKNTIRTIIDANGRFWRRKQEVSRVFLDYYTHLFTSQFPVKVDRCLENVECRVSADMNTRPVDHLW